MRLLVVGGSGFIGRYVVSHALAAGATVDATFVRAAWRAGAFFALHFATTHGWSRSYRRR